jgi:hypothetical protein
MHREKEKKRRKLIFFFSWLSLSDGHHHRPYRKLQKKEKIHPRRKMPMRMSFLYILCSSFK